MDKYQEINSLLKRNKLINIILYLGTFISFIPLIVLLILEEKDYIIFSVVLILVWLCIYLTIAPKVLKKETITKMIDKIILNYTKDKYNLDISSIQTIKAKVELANSIFIDENKNIDVNKSISYTKSNFKASIFLEGLSKVFVIIHKDSPYEAIISSFNKPYINYSLITNNKDYFLYSKNNSYPSNYLLIADKFAKNIKSNIFALGFTKKTIEYYFPIHIKKTLPNKINDEYIEEHCEKLKMILDEVAKTTIVL